MTSFLVSNVGMEHTRSRRCLTRVLHSYVTPRRTQRYSDVFQKNRLISCIDEIQILD